jgi:hypothetical protein
MAKGVGAPSGRSRLGLERPAPADLGLGPQRHVEQEPVLVVRCEHLQTDGEPVDQAAAFHAAGQRAIAAVASADPAGGAVTRSPASATFAACSFDQKTSARGRSRSARRRFARPVVFVASVSNLASTRIPVSRSKRSKTGRATDSSALA